MADSVADMAGTDMSVILKDKTYKLSRLDINDMAEFEEYIRRNKLKQYRDVFAGDPTDEKVKIIMQLQNAPLSLEDLILFLDTMTGVQFVLHRSLMKNHADLKLQDMGRLVDLENFNEVRGILDRIGVGTRPPEEGPEEGPSTGSSDSPSSPDTTTSATETSES